MIQETLNERGKTHGDFGTQASISLIIRKYLLDELKCRSIAYAQTAEKREALTMIAHKLARIVCGDPNHVDHWLDIQGYCQLVINEINSRDSE